MHIFNIKKHVWPILAGIFTILFYTLFSGGGDIQINLQNLFASPSGVYLLGTDELGRDVFSRLMEGICLSLLVGVTVMVITAIIGIVIGLISGYYGGWVDSTLMRITDVFLAFPGLLLAIALAALLQPSIGNVIFALCAMGWVGFARLTRAQVLQLKEVPFIEAAKTSGVSTAHILTRYILPNCAAPLIVEAVFAVAGAMIAEAGLSFLGLGVQAPAPSLGTLLREGARYMVIAPHLVLAPGLSLMGLVLALNIFGDKLRDKLDKNKT